MQLDLKSEEAAILRDMLRDYLPEIRREVARTDKKDLRHDLVLRQELCERLLARLGTAG